MNSHAITFVGELWCFNVVLSVVIRVDASAVFFACSRELLRKRNTLEKTRSELTRNVSMPYIFDFFSPFAFLETEIAFFRDAQAFPHSIFESEITCNSSRKGRLKRRFHDLSKHFYYTIAPCLKTALLRTIISIAILTSVSMRKCSRTKFVPRPT